MNMKRTGRIAAAIAIAGAALGLMPGSPVGATHPTITGTAVCTNPQTGGWRVDGTVSNQESYTLRNVVIGVQGGSQIKTVSGIDPDGSTTYSTPNTTFDSLTVAVSGVFDNNHGATWSQQFYRPSGCDVPQHQQITICHAVNDAGNTGNGYNLITVDDDGTYGGHGNHAGDLIPAPNNDCYVAPDPGPQPDPVWREKVTTKCAAAIEVTDYYVTEYVLVDGEWVLGDERWDHKTTEALSAEDCGYEPVVRTKDTIRCQDDALIRDYYVSTYSFVGGAWVLGDEVWSHKETLPLPDGACEPTETSEPPVETTEPPVDTTEPPTDTEPPVETTDPPVDTTEPPVTDPGTTTTQPSAPTTPGTTTPGTTGPTTPGSPTTGAPGPSAAPSTVPPASGDLPETGSPAVAILGWGGCLVITGLFLWQLTKLRSA